MVYLIEDELRRALVRNELSHAYEILLTGKISGITEDAVPEDATVLHFSAMLGYKDCVQTLLSKTIGELMINIQDDSAHCTPLMYAIMYQERHIAKLLIVSGKCDIKLCDVYQQTPLHLEAQAHSNTAEIAYYLVKYGSEIDAQDSEGMTPFLRAIETNNITVAKFLYAQRCDTSLVCNAGRSPIHIAAQHCHEEILKWLIRIRCPMKSLTIRQQTALMLTVVQRKPTHLLFNIMQLLIQAGVDINAQDYLGNTALLLATSNAAHIHKHHVELLLLDGADPNIANHDGVTPLWQAVFDGIHYSDRLKLVEMFIAENTDLDTPCRGHLLFMSGLNSVYSYENAMSPFEVALDSGFHGATRLLLVAGALVRSHRRSDAKYPDHIPREMHWIHQLLHSPVILQHNTRLVLRALLGRPILNKVRRLPLPQRIKNYILLRDIISADAFLH